jgi:aspartate-semialdehyde dehydrogenase
MSGKRVVVVGATGAVGTEILRVLEKRDFPVSELIPLASARSAGKTIPFGGEEVLVQEVSEDAFAGVDIAMFSAGATRSKQFAPAAIRAGAVVVDNSSAFRMDDKIPLVVPEINADAMVNHEGLIANPNCAAIILCMAVAPIAPLAHLKRIVVSTYQSTSGAGARAMEELVEQTRGFLAGNEPEPQAFQWPIAFNLFSHNADVEDNGYNGEENKLMEETRKILGRSDLKITATCVRVAVLRAHCESVNLEFDQGIDLDAIRSAYDAFPGVQLVDNRETNHFPMPRSVTGEDDVFVGRIRHDASSSECIDLFVSGDQLLKGAALNAVQIAELL